MNVTHANASQSTDRSRPTSFLAQSIPTSGPREPRTRDFGVGYGNSSGYASTRRYASTGSESRFRFA